MPECFLDLHIVDFCQLNCRHCYLNKGNSAMPVELLKSICKDFLHTKFPLSQRGIILSGGDPLFHPRFTEIYKIVRELNGSVRLSTNGILIPEYIHIFHRTDGIQVSVDGNQKIHDLIRGQGVYEKAVGALNLLNEYKINHSISFTLNQVNVEFIDHVIELCVKTSACTLNLNIYQPIHNTRLKPLTFKEWIKIREYAIKRASKEGIHIPSICIEKGCIAGILGLSILPDGTYWDCSRNQEVIGRYPQPIAECLFWDNIKKIQHRDQWDTCCKRLIYG